MNSKITILKLLGFPFYLIYNTALILKEPFYAVLGFPAFFYTITPATNEGFFIHMISIPITIGSSALVVAGIIEKHNCPWPLFHLYANYYVIVMLTTGPILFSWRKWSKFYDEKVINESRD